MEKLRNFGTDACSVLLNLIPQCNKSTLLYGLDKKEGRTFSTTIIQKASSSNGGCLFVFLQVGLPENLTKTRGSRNTHKVVNRIHKQHGLCIHLANRNPGDFSTTENLAGQIGACELDLSSKHVLARPDTLLKGSRGVPTLDAKAGIRITHLVDYPGSPIEFTPNASRRS